MAAQGRTRGGTNRRHRRRTATCRRRARRRGHRLPLPCPMVTYVQLSATAASGRRRRRRRRQIAAPPPPSLLHGPSSSSSSIYVLGHLSLSPSAKATLPLRRLPPPALPTPLRARSSLSPSHCPSLLKLPVERRFPSNAHRISASPSSLHFRFLLPLYVPSSRRVHIFSLHHPVFPTFPTPRPFPSSPTPDSFPPSCFCHFPAPPEISRIPVTPRLHELPKFSIPKFLFSLPSREISPPSAPKSLRRLFPQPKILSLSSRIAVGFCPSPFPQLQCHPPGEFPTSLLISPDRLASTIPDDPPSSPLITFTNSTPC